jgi:uncharacterized protein
MKRQTFAKSVFPFLLLLFLVPRVHAQSIPTVVPYVNDFANVIDQSYENAINNYAAQLEAATTAEIAVLTLDTTQPMSIEEYAVEVFEKNGIGQKGEDNGLLIVAAIEDRRWKIEVGYGLEGDINDAKAGRIGRAYITPYFQEEKYGEGLYLTVQTLGEIISGNATLSAEFDSTIYDYELDMKWIYIMILTLVVLVFVIPIIFIIKKRRCPKCKAWMRVEYKGNKVCYICKKCGYKKCEKRKRHVPFFVFAGGRGGGGGFGGGGFGGGGSGGGGASGGW